MLTGTSIVQQIRSRLQATRRLFHRVELTAGLLSWLATAALFLTLLVGLESIFHLPSLERTIVVGVCSLSLFLSFAWFVLRPFLRVLNILPSKSDFDVAILVGNHFRAVQDRLANVLQIHDHLIRRGTPFSAELTEASLQDVWTALEPLDLRLAVSRAPVIKGRRLFLTAGLLPMIVLVSVFPSASLDSLSRLVHFQEDFAQPSRLILDVAPGNTEVVKNDDVPIAVRVRTATTGLSVDAADVRLRWRLTGQTAFESAPLHRDSAGLFRGTLRNLRSSTEYTVQADEVLSPLYVLTVLDRPVIRSFHVHLDFPRYTRIPPRVLDEFVGDVTALPGTIVNIRGQANKLLRAGSLRFSDATTLPLRIDGERFAAAFRLSRDLLYHIELLDRDSLSNLHPVAYRLTLVADSPPTIVLLQPGRDVDVAGSEPLHLMLRIGDDFGFSRLRLVYRLSQSRYEQPSPDFRFITIPLPASLPPQADIPYEWTLAPLNLVPEDVVEYYVEVFDNDEISGPKSARTKTYALRLPSLEEVFADVDTAHSRSLDNLQQALDDAQQLKQKLEAIQDDLRKNREIDWQQRQKASEISRQYRNLQQKLDQAEQSLQHMVDQTQQQQALSPETLEKYLELQQLFQELDSAELQRALQRLQQAMQNVNRDQLQQALQQLQFSEARFRQGIERTLNLLKRIQIEQKLDELRKRAADLTAAQQELEHQTSDSTGVRSSEDLGARQEDLRTSAAQLQEKSTDVQRRMEEFFTEMPGQDLAELNKSLTASNVPSQMHQAASQLQRGENREASQTQRSILQQLSNFSNGLQNVQQSLLQQQLQHTVNELRRATSGLLELSKRQEELKDLSSDAAANSPRLREDAQEQLGLRQALGRLMEQLSQLSQKSLAITPEMGRTIGKAFGHMQQALQALETRNGGGASQQQLEAMGSLNKAAMQTQSALQALMQGGEGAGGSLLQQLQGLAGQQMTINLKAQQLAEQLAGQRAAEAARLAAQQEVVRKSLEQLNREAQASADRQRLLGDLERIAQEMREVVRDLEQNDVNPETMQKQDRILSRLLDAARSMRERDYEKLRTSKPGTPFARRSPGQLDASSMQREDRLQEDLLKALEQGYAKDYEELIRRYFEALQKRAAATP